MKYQKELWVFSDRHTLSTTLHWQLNLKAGNIVWCQYESWANIEREDVTILMRIVPTLGEAHKYAGMHFNKVVFHPHELSFDADVVKYLKTRVRCPGGTND